MRLFKRISDIVSANLNDLVDRCEDPESMLNQAVREMEAAIASTFEGNTFEIVSEHIIGPAVGETLRKDAQKAVLLRLLGLA